MKQNNIFCYEGIHAREWISPAVGTFLIRQLATTIEGRMYLRHFNVHAVPVLNPDGYEFSRERVLSFYQIQI